MIKENDIVFQVLSDPFDYYYLKLLVVVSVDNHNLIVTDVEDEDDLFEVHRTDIIIDHKEALKTMVDLIQFAITETKQKTKDLQARLKELKQELKTC